LLRHSALRDDAVEIYFMAELLLTFLNEKELTIIKQEAYSRGIIVQDVMSVFGVLLRNFILSQKGMPISAVDMHTSEG